MNKKHLLNESNNSEHSFCGSNNFDDTFDEDLFNDTPYEGSIAIDILGTALLKRQKAKTEKEEESNLVLEPD